jgi:quinol monooxygenase YgiN
MMTVEKNQPVVTLINVHNCLPESQDRLNAVLSEGMNTIHRHVPGFISAALHRSLDGKAVTTYAQWESAGALSALRDRPDVQEFARRVSELATFDPHLYQVEELCLPVRERVQNRGTCDQNHALESRRKSGVFTRPDSSSTV